MYATIVYLSGISHTHNTMSAPYDESVGDMSAVIFAQKIAALRIMLRFFSLFNIYTEVSPSGHCDALDLYETSKRKL